MYHQCVTLEFKKIGICTLLSSLSNLSFTHMIENVTQTLEKFNFA